ncbi:hypothetical protein ATG66_3806 [Vibrio sp. ES.051]|uniref:hypothetical protein n=1 Tax=Vibrio sp. ES.051 TaxID=1761909 RepID=UPI000BF26BD3|nr:hypothetical protein [Vibrio sp. ES.051]PFG45513.1 hypothetical protein ATG66_3806 [Vibrio sp. ES.051]
MRVSPARRRRWNNMLILGIIAFIVILNAPMWIKTYLLTDDSDPYPNLLRPDYTVSALYFNGWELERHNEQWQSNLKASTSIKELVSRWQSLEGTELTQEQYTRLKPKLTSAETVEVWYQELEEPQRVTFYRLPSFWLFKNWQDKWIAISVDADFIMPE